MRSALEHPSFVMAGGVLYRDVLRAALRRAWPLEQCWTWLHDIERGEYERLRDTNRRECWLLGRVLAKFVVRDRTEVERSNRLQPRRILIVSRDALGRRVRPRVFIDGQLQGWCLSLAYSDISIAVALADGARLNVGVDLVRRQPIGRGFREVWFSSRERAWTDAADESAADRAAAVWAIKEAFYKAANAGDRFTPGRIEVSCDNHGTYAVRVDDAELPTTCRAETTISANQISAVVTVQTSRGSMSS